MGRCVRTLQSVGPRGKRMKGECKREGGWPEREGDPPHPSGMQLGLHHGSAWQAQLAIQVRLPRTDPSHSSSISHAQQPALRTVPPLTGNCLPAGSRREALKKGGDVLHAENHSCQGHFGCRVCVRCCRMRVMRVCGKRVGCASGACRVLSDACRLLLAAVSVVRG